MTFLLAVCHSLCFCGCISFFPDYSKERECSFDSWCIITPQTESDFSIWPERIFTWALWLTWTLWSVLSLWQQEIDPAELNWVGNILTRISLYPCKIETLGKNLLNYCCFENLTAWKGREYFVLCNLNMVSSALEALACRNGDEEILGRS